MATIPTKKVLAAASLFVVLALPILVSSLTGNADLHSWLMMGAITAVTSRLFGSTAMSLGAVVGAALMTGLVGLIADWPVAVGVVFALVAFGLGMSARFGAYGAFTLVPIVAGFATSGLTDTADIGRAALAVAIGGLWTFAVVDALARRRLLPVAPRREPLGQLESIGFATLLGVAAGVVAGVVAAIDVPHASWAILTLFVVAQPTFSDTVTKALSRCAGTILGGLVAVLVGTLLPWPGVWMVVALAAVPVIALTISGTYWHYATALTVVVVLSGATSTEDLVSTDGYRVLFTLAASAYILVIVWLGHRLLERLAARQSTTANR